LKQVRKILFFSYIVVLLSAAACSPQVVTPTSAVVTATQPPVVATKITTLQPTPVVNEFDVDPADLDGLQISFIHPWTGGVLDEMFLLVDEFNQTNQWGVHVIMTAPGSAALVTSKTREGIVNDQAPNVLAAPPDFILAVDANDDLVVDLNPYIDSTTYGISEEEIADFSALFWDDLSVRGKRIAIPAQESTLLLAYNKTWANELGFPRPPVNADEFRAQMCAANASFLKDADTTNDGLGGWLINTDPIAMFSWFKAFGAKIQSANGYTFSGEAGEEVFNYLLSLRNDSCAWVGRSEQDETYFTNRQALAVGVWMQDLPVLAGALERAGSDDEWTVIPFPGSEKQVLTNDGISLAVLHDDPAEDLAAWLFIRWLSEPSQQFRLLKQLGTIPLTSKSEQALLRETVMPQWKDALNFRNVLVTQPVDSNWMNISMVLEDAGWQLLKAGITADQIPLLLQDMDDLATELVEINP
jgi:multiple sugar transport system substrate-binding protein